MRQALNRFCSYAKSFLTGFSSFVSYPFAVSVQGSAGEEYTGDGAVGGLGRYFGRVGGFLTSGCEHFAKEHGNA